MFSLMRAEWLKLPRQGVTQVLALMLLGMALLIPLISVVNVNSTGNLNFRQDSYNRLAFPNATLTGLDTLLNMGVIFISVLIGSIIGSEYSLDTWKNLLIRQNGRIHFLVAKLLVGGGALLLAFVVWLIVTQLLALAGHSFATDAALNAGLKPTPDTSNQFWQGVYQDGVPELLYFTVAASITTAFTILGRSTVAGIMVTLVWWIGENISRRLLPDWLQNLTVVKNEISLQQNLMKSGAGELATWYSLAIFAAYIVIPLAIAFVVFHLRDMA